MCEPSQLSVGQALMSSNSVPRRPAILPDTSFRDSASTARPQPPRRRGNPCLPPYPPPDGCVVSAPTLYAPHSGHDGAFELPVLTNSLPQPTRRHRHTGHTARSPHAPHTCGNRVSGVTGNADRALHVTHSTTAKYRGSVRSSGRERSASYRTAAPPISATPPAAITSLRRRRRRAHAPTD